MLIDFTIKNYRSIRASETLSAVAASHALNSTDDSITKPWPVEGRSFQLLPVLGIFGANASGKSNVLNSLAEFLGFIYFGRENRPNHYDTMEFVDPFRLNSKSANEPTDFEMRVARGGNIYAYQISISSGRILHEKLEYTPSASKRLVGRLLFERTWNGKTESYDIVNGRDFGSSLLKMQQSLRETQPMIGILIRTVKRAVTEPLADWFAFFWLKVSLEDNFDYALACHLLTNLSPDLFLKRFFERSFLIAVKKRYPNTSYDYYRSLIHYRNLRRRIRQAINQYPNADTHIFLAFGFPSFGLSRKTTVQFGDGVTGARLPTGQENVRAIYRKGIGLEGLVKAEQLSLLMTRPLGVK